MTGLLTAVLIAVSNSGCGGSASSAPPPPSPATHFAVTAPATATAGTSFSFAVTALDASNNVATSYSGIVSFTSTDGQAALPGNSMLTSGTANLSATLNTAGCQTIAATDTVTASITGKSSSINVSAGAATHFSVSAPATATAGTSFPFNVTALDALNNVATGYSGKVQFTSTDGQAALPPSSTLANGAANFMATLKTAGSQTITATDMTTASITGASTITVSAGVATRFSVTAPATANAGTSFAFTVTAFDALNNVATGYPGTVQFTSTDGQAALPMNATLTNGTTNFLTTLKTDGGQTISATDTVTASITGKSNSIGVSTAAAANRVPLISQPLVPDAVAPGGAGFMLKANGTGFVSGSVVNWNGSALATTFVSGSQLTASVPTSDVAMPGTASVTVFNPSPDGGTSNTAFFPISLAGNVAMTASDYGVGSSPPAVSTGDLNGDGKLDLVVANSSDSTISVLLGNGDGTFQAQATYAVGQNPRDIAIADFNGDGKLDLAVANVNSNTVSVLLGNGDGTFQPQVQYPTGTGAWGVAAADVNGDGKLDLLITNSGDTTVSLLLGNGDGTFQPHVDYQAGQGPTSLAVGDFNRDGKLDLAVADFGSSDTVAVLLGNGDGTFSTPTTYPTGSAPRFVAAVDFNGDGKLDLAVANQGDTTISILLGNGDGTFQPQVTYATSAGPTSVVVGDFNGDGKLDLATPGFGSGTSVSVLLGNGDGTFQPHMDFTAGQGPYQLAIGDFNEDGRLDLAAADQNSNTVSVLLQVGTIMLSSPSLSFNNQLVGSSSPAQMVTVTNTSTALPVNISSIAVAGTNASDFGETNNCALSLAPGASCTINVTFAPSQVGPRTASLTITDDAPGSPQMVSLAGTGVISGPNPNLSPATLTFATQLVATTSSSQAVTFSDYGTAAISITSIAASSNFGESGNNCASMLVAGAACTINLTFTPTAAGKLSGTLSVTDNAPGSPQTVSLNGVGTFVGLNPNSLGFGLVATPEGSKTLSATLTNTGTTKLTITNITITGTNPGDFSQTNTCGSSVAPGGSCAITVTFKPVAVGGFTAAVTITDSDAGSPQQITLSGRGIRACSPFYPFCR